MIISCIIAGLSVISALSIISAITWYKDYKKIKHQYENVQHEMERRYVKMDIILHNAVLEAYENALKTNNMFTAKKYQKLLNEMKGKWS